jgi:hypothetical protein
VTMTAHPFPGTDQELFRLAAAAAHNCTCEPSPDGIVGPTCPAHRMLLDEDLGKHLVNSARQAKKWLQGEFNA